MNTLGSVYQSSPCQSSWKTYIVLLEAAILIPHALTFIEQVFGKKDTKSNSLSSPTPSLIPNVLRYRKSQRKQGCPQREFEKFTELRHLAERATREFLTGKSFLRPHVAFEWPPN